MTAAFLPGLASVSLARRLVHCQSNGKYAATRAASVGISIYNSRLDMLCQFPIHPAQTVNADDLSNWKNRQKRPVQEASQPTARGSV